MATDSIAPAAASELAEDLGIEYDTSEHEKLEKSPLCNLNGDSRRKWLCSHYRSICAFLCYLVGLQSCICFLAVVLYVLDHWSCVVIVFHFAQCSSMRRYHRKRHIYGLRGPRRHQNCSRPLEKFLDAGNNRTLSHKTAGCTRQFHFSFYLGDNSAAFPLKLEDLF